MDLSNDLGLTEDEIRENNKLIMKLRHNGLWEQIHGTVLPKDDYEPTTGDWAELEANIKKLSSQ